VQAWGGQSRSGRALMSELARRRHSCIQLTEGVAPRQFQVRAINRRAAFIIHPSTLTHFNADSKLVVATVDAVCSLLSRSMTTQLVFASWVHGPSSNLSLTRTKQDRVQFAVGCTLFWQIFTTLAAVLPTVGSVNEYSCHSWF
jgi:hypothetical protein